MAAPKAQLKLATMNIEKELHCLMLLYFRLVQSEAGKEISPETAWKNDAQVLAIKIFRHISSARNLSAGVKFELEASQPIEFIDHSSVCIVTRAALESYLAFNYIYINEHEAISMFRHKTWQLAGLIDRSKLLASTSEAKTIQEKEAKDIASLKIEMANSEYFLNETEGNKKRILAGKWRPQLGWGEMASHAGFHRGYFDNIYNHVSGHSHASFISALQTRDAKHSQDQASLANAMKQICCVIMAHFCFAYIKLFRDADLVFNLDAVLYGVAHKWHIGVDDMNKVYGARQ